MKIFKAKIFNLLCLIGFYSTIYGCINANENNLTKNDFDKLDKVIVSLESQICGGQSWEICYKDWFIKREAFGLDSVLSKFDYKKFSSSFENDIPNKLRNDIFSECKAYNNKNEREYLGLCANTKGGYIKFLTKLGQKDNWVNKYVDHIKSSGDYGAFPFLENFIDIETKEFKKLNTESDYFKIITSIHIIYTIESYFRDNEQ